MCEFLFGRHIRLVWLVIVDYLHIFGTLIGPLEHDAPLIIDADRMLTRQIALKSFEAVAGMKRSLVMGLALTFLFFLGFVVAFVALVRY